VKRKNDAQPDGKKYKNEDGLDLLPALTPVRYPDLAPFPHY